MGATLSRALLSAFAVGVAIAFAYLAWVTAFAAMYAATPLLFLPSLVIIIFVGVTFFWVALSWFRRTRWVRGAYAWSSSLIFLLVCTLYVVDGMNEEKAVAVAVIGLVLFLNWHAMRLLHANAT